MGDTLKVVWSKRERDLLISYPSKPDGHLVHNVLNCKRCHPDMKGLFGVTWEPSFIDELEARGYDLTTLKFSIKRKPTLPTHTDGERDA